MHGGSQTIEWLIVPALLGVWGFWYGFRSLAQARTVADTPASKIRSASQGYAELVGVGVLPPSVTIKGPLTGIECAWWEYRIEDRRDRRGDRNNWQTIDSQKSDTPFLLDDGTGQCLVDPQGAEVVVHESTSWYGDTPWPEVRIPDGNGLLERAVDALFSGGRYRYIERRLSVAAPLYALGVFRTSGGASIRDPEDEVAAVLHEWKADQAGLLRRFDANHDGRIDLAEWEQVRAAARDQVMRQRSSEAPPPAVPTLAAPDDGRPFLLSGADPVTLMRRLRLRAAAGIAVFVAAAAAFTWLAGRLALP